MIHPNLNPTQSLSNSPRMGDHDEKKAVQRLPVNPRRHKVAPEQRKRVATACNSCNVRRIKCSGEKPCKQCRNSSRECVYPAPVEKVSVSKSELDDLRRQLSCLDKALQDVIPDAMKRKELLSRMTPATPTAESPASPAGSSIAPSLWHSTDGDTLSAESVRSESVEDDRSLPTVTEGRLLRDAVGNVRFHGETSTDVFVDALKECFASIMPPTAANPFLSATGTYQSNDSISIDTSDVDPLWFPSAAHMSVVFAELRHFIQDGAGDWTSGGIQFWGDLTTLPVAPMVSGLELETSELQQYRHLAFYQAALAVACRATLTKSPNSESESPMCETYFARASLLIGNPLDVSRYHFGDAATLGLMAFYLIEGGRLDAAYMYLGAAMRISVMQGIHRGFVDEAGKRVFWTVYCLDRQLALLTGRPVSLPDEAIQLPLPQDTPGLPAAAGLCAHVELFRTTYPVLSALHAASPSGNSPDLLNKAVSNLERWRQALPASLTLTPDGLSPDPAVCALHILYNQLLSIATRSSLIRTLQDHIASPSNSSPSESLTQHARATLTAARHTVRLGRHILILNRPRKLLHSGLHGLFNAAIIVLLQEFLYSPALTPDELSTGRRMVEFVTEGFEGESRMGNMFARDGVKTLRELRMVIARYDMLKSQMPSLASQTALLGIDDGSMQTDGQGDDMIYDYLMAMTDDEWRGNVNGV